METLGLDSMLVRSMIMGDQKSAKKKSKQDKLRELLAKRVRLMKSIERLKNDKEVIEEPVQLPEPIQGNGLNTEL